MAGSSALFLEAQQAIADPTQFQTLLQRQARQAVLPNPHGASLTALSERGLCSGYGFAVYFNQSLQQSNIIALAAGLSHTPC